MTTKVDALVSHALALGLSSDDMLQAMVELGDHAGATTQQTEDLVRLLGVCRACHRGDCRCESCGAMCGETCSDGCRDADEGYESEDERRVG